MNISMYPIRLVSSSISSMCLIVLKGLAMRDLGGVGGGGVDAGMRGGGGGRGGRGEWVVVFNRVTSNLLMSFPR